MLGAPTRHRSARPPSRRISSRRPAGLRRLDWVRIDLTGERPRAVAHGALHRLPRTVAISVDEAVRLARRGVPLIVRRPGGED